MLQKSGKSTSTTPKMKMFLVGNKRQKCNASTSELKMQPTDINSFAIKYFSFIYSHI